MHNERPHDSRPHFVIPYWSSSGPGDPGDDGDLRPLPGNIVSYLCSAIHASPFNPGQRLDVTVDVRNFGGANTPSQAQVTVWWADPTTGFVLSSDKLIGFQMFAIPPRGGQATSLVMSKDIPATAPPHICLLARVSHQFDHAGNIPDPVKDRHWAQRNLAVVTAPPGVPIKFAFLAGNPLKEDAGFILVAKPAAQGLLRPLADELQAEPVAFEGLIVLGESEDIAVDEGNRPLASRLRAGEQRQIFLRVIVSREIERGQFAAIDIVQLHEETESVVGSLGLTVKGD